MNRAAYIGVAIALPIILLIGLLSFVVLFVFDENCLFDDGDSPGGLIDPENVPEGPIAGYSGVQLVNAAWIIRAGQVLGLSLRDQKVGVMTAMGESSLRVLDHGDSVGPDSRGLFQQRDSWGSEAERMDPFKSATLFFNVLKDIPGRDTIPPTLLAHQVQRNADPFHYAPYWDAAVEVTDTLLAGGTGKPPGEVPRGKDPYGLGAVTPQLRALVYELAPRFDIETVGGYRPGARDMNGHPAGLAADFMVPLTSSGKAQGDALAAYARANAERLGVDYIIWYQKIWSVERAAEGWRPMEDRGDPTQNHLDHVHINVLADFKGGDPAPPPGGENDCEQPQPWGQTWVAPLDAPITSDYGWRINPYSGQRSFHDGVDYGAACGTPFVSASTGLVEKASPDSIYGHQIIVNHGGGIKTRYGHMYPDGVNVRIGDNVTTGQRIGEVGSAGWSTGCHLHFTVEVDGETVDPIKFLANPPQTGGTRAMKLAHANIKVSLSSGAFAQDIAKVAGTGADFITLNEVPRRSKAQLTPPGYVSWRTGNQRWQREVAVLWRADEWRSIDRGIVYITTSHRDLDNRAAVWVTLVPRDGKGMPVSVISTHAMTNPIRSPKSIRAERIDLYRRGMANLNALTSELSSAGPVLLGGDLNSWAPRNGGMGDPWGPTAQLRASGLISSFERLGEPSGGWATHDGGGTIDYVFSNGPAPTAHATRNLNSDHKMLLVRFGLN